LLFFGKASQNSGAQERKVSTVKGKTSTAQF